jgi:hypothetical protein
VSNLLKIQCWSYLQKYVAQAFFLNRLNDDGSVRKGVNAIPYFLYFSSDLDNVHKIFIGHCHFPEKTMH